MECPKCHSKVADGATPEEFRQKFYARRAGTDFWVCLECNRAFHAATKTIVS
jgi:ribosomal protein L37AE/L43A